MRTADACSDRKRIYTDYCTAERDLAFEPDFLMLPLPVFAWFVVGGFAVLFV